MYIVVLREEPPAPRENPPEQTTEQEPNLQHTVVMLERSLVSIRSRSPAVPVGTYRHQSQQDPPPVTPPLPGLGFIPYVRTHEVFNLDPLEPDDIPPPRTQAGSIHTFIFKPLWGGGWCVPSISPGPETCVGLLLMPHVKFSQGLLFSDQLVLHLDC